MIGSITTMAQFEDKYGHMKEILRGLVVAVILLLSTVSPPYIRDQRAPRLSDAPCLGSQVSGFAAGWVSDKLSRKGGVTF